MQFDAAEVMKDFVDYLMPELKPHESAVYIFLLRKSHLDSGSQSVRVGQRSTAPQYGRGKEASAPSRNQLIKQLKSLESKGCIAIGNTNREGTLYTVLLPREIGLVKAKLDTITSTQPEIDDYFTTPSRRKEIFERDNWCCGYCGERVNEANATLDHVVPQRLGGTHSQHNLRTACLMCNSIKSGRSEEEASVLLLKSIRDRQAKRRAP